YSCFRYSDGFFLIGPWVPPGQRSGRVGHPKSERPEYDGRKPPACAAQIFRPGNLSSVPSKIRCESAMVVSSGLPITLPRKPLPLKRLEISEATPVPCG